MSAPLQCGKPPPEKLKLELLELELDELKLKLKLELLELLELELLELLLELLALLKLLAHELTQQAGGGGAQTGWQWPWWPQPPDTRLSSSTFNWRIFLSPCCAARRRAGPAVNAGLPRSSPAFDAAPVPF